MTYALPQFIRFGRAVCGDLTQAERREWWLSNGLGGYAAGTIAGTLTRRYHGLLLAPLASSLGRVLVFAKADASLVNGDRCWPLYTNRWASGAVDPQGYLHLESFHLDGRLPVWRYAIGDLRVEARVWMEPGAHTTYVAYQLLPSFADPAGFSLMVRLLVNGRDHHGQTQAGGFDPHVMVGNQELCVTVTESATLRLRTRHGRFDPGHTWIEQFQLPLEQARGLPDEDNHLCVGQVSLPLRSHEWAGFVVSLEDNPCPDLAEALGRRQHYDSQLLQRVKAHVASGRQSPAWIEQLVLAADSFLIERPVSKSERSGSVIAGYPWFGDWGRDTFIALPGLTLATRRHGAARRLLESWAHYLDQGMLPNRFPESGAPPEYNTVDAALWYIEAWRAYMAASDDQQALRRHFQALAGIVSNYTSGTRHGIGLDPADGLIRGGEQGVQITWMDAKIGDWVVTPRTGKSVEINALWYNALMTLASFSAILGEDPAPYLDQAEQTRHGFRRFIRKDGRGLFDVLDSPQGDDATLRPNQILTVSLHHSPLTSTEQATVVTTVGASLLTSYGLRTLEPGHPDYRPRYEGGVAARDAAYHQGPAWTWLLGHYALAVYRVSSNMALAQSYLEPLRDHLFDAGLGTVGELFDGEPPHAPRGAPAQAWSVACVLEAWCRLEEVKKPSAGSDR